MTQAWCHYRVLRFLILRLQLKMGGIRKGWQVHISVVKGLSSSNVAKITEVYISGVQWLANFKLSFPSSALSACDCSFEHGLCVWMQGGEDELDWLSRSGPTETPNTGPAGDHTTGKGKYIFIKSSPPSVKGNMAQLKSPLLPPAGEKGYCLTFWYHMFGATVGSLRILLQTVWQQSGNQGDEWLLVQSHVTLQKVHQVILEAAVGGEAGDIAIDDISLISGSCLLKPPSPGLIGLLAFSWSEICIIIALMYLL
uniref:MAM domain-containing protein n=1 Tax=Monopterus albus TaxID=43700 RepID=A0A3Q3K2K1_MONAL